MVLKKPYGFLIKNFKIIHLILLALTVFITYKYTQLVTTFSKISSISIGYKEGSKYVSPFLYLVILLIVGISLLIYLLMKEKNKPRNFYLLTMVYYAVIFLLLVYASNVIDSLYDAEITQKAARAYRDIYFISSLPSVYFIVVSFLRGIGFDVKRFNFAKDLEELEIDKSDSEEFEFVLGTDSYLYKRKARRVLRELKYYVLENKFFVTIIVGSFVGVISIAGIINYGFVNKTYHVGDRMTTMLFKYKINDAYFTAKNFKVEEMNNKNYLILNVTVDSIYSDQSRIKPEYFYLLLKNGEISEHRSSLSYFLSDLGVSYQGDPIKGEGNKFLLVFEVPDKCKQRTYTLKVYNDLAYEDDEPVLTYNKLKVTPKNLDKKESNVSKEYNEPIYLGSSLYGNTNVTISSASTINSYERTYEDCETDGKCVTKYEVIKPSNQNAKDFLLVKYDLKVDANSLLHQSIKKSINEGFFTRFAKVGVKKGNEIVEYDVNPVEIEGNTEEILLETTNFISKTQELYLIIQSREVKFSIKVK